jgi:hypothetical protein
VKTRANLQRIIDRSDLTSTTAIIN